MNRLIARLSLTPAVSQIQPQIPDGRKQGSECGFKKALVVGGTKGIGSGIAKALYTGGFCERVDIVGRDASAGESMLAKLGGSSRFWKADLGTLQGCDELVGLLAKEEEPGYDVLVLTMGVWPDFWKPLTWEGFHAVFFLDVIARFRVLHGMIQQGLLASAHEGRPPLVCSVLASSQTPILGDDATQEERVKFLQESVLKRHLNGDYKQSQNLPGTLRTAGFAHDTMFATAASKHQNVQFVGTFPGLVTTGVAQTTVGRRLGGLLNFFGSWVPGGLVSADVCGEQHVRIMEEVAERSSTGDGAGNLSFWNASLLTQHCVPNFEVSAVGSWFWEQLRSLSPD